VFSDFASTGFRVWPVRGFLVWPPRFFGFGLFVDFWFGPPGFRVWGRFLGSSFFQGKGDLDRGEGNANRGTGPNASRRLLR